MDAGSAPATRRSERARDRSACWTAGVTVDALPTSVIVAFDEPRLRSADRVDAGTELVPVSRTGSPSPAAGPAASRASLRLGSAPDATTISRFAPPIALASSAAVSYRSLPATRATWMPNPCRVVTTAAETALGPPTTITWVAPRRCRSAVTTSGTTPAAVSSSGACLARAYGAAVTASITWAASPEASTTVRDDG